MTSNEQVCERMGWEITNHMGVRYTYTPPGGIYLYKNLGTNNQEGYWLMHLMKQKLVEEGLEVIIRIYGDNHGAMALEHVYHNDPDDIETIYHGSVDNMD